jgi:RNA polymerase sigma factor (sigma-70 family)
VKFEEEFVAFAEASAPRLRRTAYLLCGDWHTSEDLVQSALARVFVAWRRIRQQDSAHAYATRTLMNCYLSDRRRKRPVEILTDHLPDFGKEAPAPETRLVVQKALAGLPPKSRAVVVLRYWAWKTRRRCSAARLATCEARACGPSPSCERYLTTH